MKKIFILILLVMSISVYSTNFAGGSGTIDDPYLISTAEHLNNIRYHMDKHFKQINDIDLSVFDNWEPIGIFIFDRGRRIDGFYGTFDGNGYTIKNLTINRPNEHSVGLFGCLQRKGVLNNVTYGELKNIRLENIDVVGNTIIGGLVAYNEGIISNSYVQGTIYGEKAVGGLVGTSSGIIKDSNVNAEIFGKTNLGILAGEKFKWLSYTGIVENSYSTGKVEGEINIGGLIGHNNGEVTNSYSKNIVIGEKIVGGLVGLNYIESEISNTFSKSKINGNQYIGGLVGLNEGKLRFSYATGEVSGNKDAGGLIGVNKGQVLSSYYDYETTGQWNSSGGLRRTTEQMKRKANYITINSWDFENIWEIDEDVSYPYFKWQVE